MDWLMAVLEREEAVKEIEILKDEIKELRVSKRRADAAEEQVDALHAEIEQMAQKQDATALRCAKLERRMEQSWELNESGMKLDEELGSGQFGTVYAAVWQGMDVAIKCVRRVTPVERKLAGDLLRNECRKLAQVRHRNVLRLYGICMDPEPRLVMERAHGGTLAMALNRASRDGQESLPREYRFSLITGMARGMAALHSRGILHLDLKPANILISKDGTPWVADFGLSMSLSSLAVASTAVSQRGTLQYKAPELFEIKPKTSTSTDVWAYGVIVFQVLSLCLPWATLGKHIDTAIYAALRDGLNPDYECEVDWRSLWVPPLIQIVDMCWEVDPSNRSPFDTILLRLEELALLFPSSKTEIHEEEDMPTLTLNQKLADAEDRRKEAEQEVAELRQETAAHRARADAEMAVLPENWTSQHDDGGDRSDLQWWISGRCLVDVKVGGSEWLMVSKLLSSLPDARVLSIKRIENRLLWRRYWSKRREVALKLSKNFSGTASEDTVPFGPRIEGQVGEMRMWHGTGRTDPAVIVDHEVGLDHRFSCGGFYGHGLYLAEKARYSHGDDERKFAHCRPDGSFSLVLVRASMGQFFDFGDVVSSETKRLKMPPPREDHTGFLYDAVRGGPHRPSKSGPGDCDSPIFVLYDLCQAYPEFIIDYSV